MTLTVDGLISGNYLAKMYTFIFAISSLVSIEKPYYTHNASLFWIFGNVVKSQAAQALSMNDSRNTI